MVNHSREYFVLVYTRYRDQNPDFDDFLRRIKKRIFIYGFIDSILLKKTTLRESE